MNCVSHIVAGTWRHPESQAARYKDLEYWTDLAKLLERGLFDGLFIADVLGVYDVYGGGPQAALRAGAQVPVNDPLLLVSAMATVTKHLGFGITAATSFEHPYSFARRMSTLDHLTKGRVGWNVVTGYLESAARNHGLNTITPHADRYDIADEYTEVLYKLWEGSWEDDAVGTDPGRAHYADPEVALALWSGWLGTDLSRFHLDDPDAVTDNEYLKSSVSMFGQGQWTLRDFVDAHAIDAEGGFTVGSPTQVADDLQSWVEE